MPLHRIIPPDTSSITLVTFVNTEKHTTTWPNYYLFYSASKCIRHCITFQTA
jgi:hypothetical protein